MDLTALSAEDLEAHRVAVLSEIERRQRLATAAETVAQIATRYIEDGGDVADLAAALPA